MLHKSYNLVVIGAGIVGLVLALKIKRNFPNYKILILDKEIDSTSHGTGRNSGVIHSGIYYPPETLRAKYCVSGSKQMKKYVKEKNLWIDECGKILLPTSKESLKTIDVLMERSIKNGVEANILSPKQINELEPNANPVFDIGIHIPFTSIVDPKEVALSIKSDLERSGVEIFYSSPVSKVDSENGLVKFNNTEVISDLIINSAGLQSDTIAKKSSYKTDYSFSPFKGKYWYVSDPNFKMTRLLYPIPNLDLPFLGIHTVHNKKNKVYIGPSSTPVFGRENYSGFKGLKILEFIYLLFSFAKKFLLNTNGLRTLAFREFNLILPNGVFNEAKNLVKGLNKSSFKLSNEKVGIRSQIFDKKEKTLVSDFMVEKQNRVIHILNAISPAFTASFGLADYILKEYFDEL